MRARFVGYALVAWAMAAPLAHAGEVVVEAPKADVPDAAEAVVRLRVKTASEISALQGGIEFDPSVVEAVDVKTGSGAPEGARADFNRDRPGWLAFGFVASPGKSGFKGEGVALEIRFRGKGRVGSRTTLSLKNVRAWEPSDAELLVKTTDGSLTIGAATSSSWMLAVGIALALSILFLVRRSRKPRATVHRPTVGGGTSATGAAAGRFCTGCGASVAPNGHKFCGKCGAPLP